MKLKLFFLSFFISFIGYSQTIFVSGVISTNTTWNVDTVKITGDVTVNDLVTLAIDPGTYVEFQGYFQIHIRGRLLAKGSISDSVYFAINDTSGFSNPSVTLGGWKTIYIQAISASNDTSIFEYCKIVNSKLESIFVQDSKIRIEHCTFLNNFYTGIYLFYCRGLSICRYNYFKFSGTAFSSAYSKSVISDNVIDSNLTGIVLGGSVQEVARNIITNNAQRGVVVSQLSPGSSIHDNLIQYNSQGMYLQKDTAEIFNNIISHNSCAYTGGGISGETSYSFVHHNTISYNTAMGGSGVMMSGRSESLISSNKIANNYSFGIGCGSTDNGAGILCLKSEISVVNNLICNNTTESNGGAIGCLDSSSVTLINNTIVNNDARNSYGGGGLALENDCIFNMENNIIWGNDAPTTSKQLLLNPFAIDVNSNYCDIADTNNFLGYTGANYQNLMMSDPKFVSSSAGAGIGYDGLAANWSLQSISPCINAGNPDTSGLQLYPTDILGTSRILMGNIDIGAYEFDVSVNTFDANTFINSDLHIFPNPVCENINIILKNILPGSISIKITNVLGQIVYTENTESVSSFYSGSVNTLNFKDGIYSLIISDNSGKTHSSLIVKK